MMMMLSFGLPTALQGLLSIFLWSTKPLEPNNNNSVTLRLRHRHAAAATNTSRILFSDDVPQVVAPRRRSLASGEPALQFTIPVLKSTVPRPSSSFEALDAAARKGRTSQALDWDQWEVQTPDVSKRGALLRLAEMSSNSYYMDNATSPADWYDFSSDDGGWTSTPHGWQPEDDGLRGHIFVSDDNSTVVISIKGTSASWLVGGGGPTVHKDKLNDNLLFSCCCGRVGPTWSPVCGCFKGNYRCDADCVEDALRDDGLFYPIGLNLYNNVTYLYPNANIWLTGHSLGGSLAVLMGATFGAPVVAFEAPAERMAWQRLHLPPPPTTHHITHVYHTADPIPQGICTGVTSLCALGGFALESRCHTGQVILYDTVQKLGWSVDVRNHPVKVVIDRLLGEDAEWKPEFNEDVTDTDTGADADTQAAEDADTWFRALRWGFGWPGKKKEEDPRPRPPPRQFREVPLARPAIEVEGADGVCTDCFSWEYGRDGDATASLSCNGP